MANLPNHVHCTLCEKQKDEPNSGVQQCKCTNWGHAKCIHFTGIYSMLSIKTGWEVHNDIQLLSKKGGKNVLLSATAIWQEKKTKKVGVSALRVSCLINMESLWLSTSWEGGVLFNTNVVFWWKEEMKKGFTIQLNAENRQRPRHTTQQQMIISYTMGGTT